jgi:hypothetical protein
MYDQVLFGLTAVVSFLSAGVVAWLFVKSRDIPKLLWSLSFVILGLSTALISIDGLLPVLGLSYVAPLDSLIPGLMGAGLLMYSKENWGFYFLMYVILVFCALFALSFSFSALSAQYTMLVHFPGGLIIFILPIYLAITKKLAPTSLLVGLGGLFIGIGGMAIATLSTSFQMLPQDLVLNIVAPIFLGMTVLIAIGILVTPHWGFKTK